jgi:GTPase involved in cell partitioning and DNA repair
MDVTIVGLQNAGKTSLLRVLAVSGVFSCPWFFERVGYSLALTARDGERERMSEVIEIN